MEIGDLFVSKRERYWRSGFYPSYMASIFSVGCSLGLFIKKKTWTEENTEVVRDPTICTGRKK
jgi:hypothetical protein